MRRLKLLALATLLAAFARTADAHHCGLEVASSGRMCPGELFTLTTLFGGGDCLFATWASFDPGPTVFPSGLSVPLGQPWIFMHNNGRLGPPTTTFRVPEGIALLGETVYFAALSNNHPPHGVEVAAHSVPICP